MMSLSRCGFDWASLAIVLTVLVKLSTSITLSCDNPPLPALCSGGDISTYDAVTCNSRSQLAVCGGTHTWTSSSKTSFIYTCKSQTSTDALACNGLHLKIDSATVTSITIFCSGTQACRNAVFEINGAVSTLQVSCGTALTAPCENTTIISNGNILVGCRNEASQQAPACEGMTIRNTGASTKTLGLVCSQFWACANKTLGQPMTLSHANGQPTLRCFDPRAGKPTCSGDFVFEQSASPGTVSCERQASTVVQSVCDTMAVTGHFTTTCSTQNNVAPACTNLALTTTSSGLQQLNITCQATSGAPNVSSACSGNITLMNTFGDTAFYCTGADSVCRDTRFTMTAAASGSNTGNCPSQPNCDFVTQACLVGSCPCDGKCGSRIVETQTPTANPTSNPTKSPVSPSAPPSASPTAVPSLVPTYSPTSLPSTSPTSVPSQSPTVAPSSVPTQTPSFSPTTQPSMAPSSSPSIAPSALPSAAPTLSPSQLPSASPSEIPTNAPSSVPSQVPTTSPSSVPSSNPSASPSTSPTGSPSTSPTPVPSAAPTTSAPTNQPTANPTGTPTTSAPSTQPTRNPTQNPTKNPTRNPTTNPTKNPTKYPTKNPTKNPSSHPVTSGPSRVPSRPPTGFPTTSIPTSNPTKYPTRVPSRSPSQTPTDVPSLEPSGSPSSTPSRSPSGVPSRVPSGFPSSVPTGTPTDFPSSVPSFFPSTSVPSTSAPSYTPTTNPTKNPTHNPLTSTPLVSRPTSTPSMVPSTVPSAAPTQGEYIEYTKVDLVAKASQPNAQKINRADKTAKLGDDLAFVTEQRLCARNVCTHIRANFTNKSTSRLDSRRRLQISNQITFIYALNYANESKVNVTAAQVRNATEAEITTITANLTILFERLFNVSNITLTVQIERVRIPAPTGEPTKEPTKEPGRETKSERRGSDLSAGVRVAIILSVLGGITLIVICTLWYFKQKEPTPTIQGTQMGVR